MKTTKIALITARSLNFWSALIGDFILAASRSGSLFLSHTPMASLHPMNRAMNTQAWGRASVPAQEQEQTEQGAEGEGVCDHL
jgi:hypothetical protein